MKTGAQQTIDQLRAEIAFREKLARQHVTGEVVLPDYFAKEEHDRILLERVDATSRQMARLQARGVRLSPFLELGAERGQRSLVLANDFGGDGVAADISFHQLKAMEHFARLFGRERLPLRVCCNANRLPFRTGFFPFVFAYQFLHHFPTPIPIVREIHRVMARGHFFFAEEPYRRIVKVVLYQQAAKIYSQRRQRRHSLLRLLEGFISAEASDEAQHGIIENDDLSVPDWMSAMMVFDDCDAELRSTFNVTSRLRGAAGFRNLPNRLLGGLISALCRKETGDHTADAPNVAESLLCPDCLISHSEGLSGLARVDGGYRCVTCESVHPERDGVIFLLPRAELRQLYPAFALD